MNAIKEIETQEIITILREAGFDFLVETLLTERSCWTRKGRLNRSATCRAMKWSDKQLLCALRDARELLGPDLMTN
jgi:hypothetical protein